MIFVLDQMLVTIAEWILYFCYVLVLVLVANMVVVASALVFYGCVFALAVNWVHRIVDAVLVIIYIVYKNQHVC